MILQSALLLLAASAFQSSALNAAPPSVLPPNCGLTEEQVLELGVPDYRAKRADPKTHDDTGTNVDFYDAKIVDALQTSFSRGFGSFVVAAIDIRSGSCDYCQHTTLVVIDTWTHELVWRFEADGRSKPWDEKDRAVRIVRIFPDDPALTLVFRWDDIGCQGCGISLTRESWLRPKLNAESSLVFDVVWDSAVDYGTSGGAFGPTWSHEVSTEMRSLWPKRAYRFTRHTLVGWNARGEYDGSVDLMTTQEFTQDPQTLKLEPGMRSWLRRDKHPSSVFPFSLPMGALVFDAGSLPPSAPRTGRPTVVSPKGDLFVQHCPDHGWPGVQRLHFGRVNESEAAREVWSGRPVEGRAGREQLDGLEFVSLGWTRDGSRCLAIVDLGLGADAPLDVPPVMVSLTLDGKGDRWEGFLPKGYTLPDGFVLDLPEPAQKADAHH